jgi:hypothetical protein
MAKEFTPAGASIESLAHGEVVPTPTRPVALITNGCVLTDASDETVLIANEPADAVVVPMEIMRDTPVMPPMEQVKHQSKVAEPGMTAALTPLAVIAPLTTSMF